ncbi:CNBP [Mytilus edulis]|uniref:CNBP n=1 Tax=Mytilus edulis TaxID=6550 RepID=A0A8S3UNE9_MYTED|nr:CNBP [Mytilus edulis]
MWNEWTDQEKAAQLSICLRGNAQRVLSELTKSELSDYNKLRSALTQRFCPPERETAFRCEFRTRRRSRDESAAEYGYSLKRLASHAYPQIPMSMPIQQTLANFTQGQQSDFNQGNNTRPRENKIPICYTCQKEGHISRNCPEAPYRRQDNNNYNRNRRANNQRQPQNTHSDDLK